LVNNKIAEEVEKKRQQQKEEDEEATKELKRSHRPGKGKNCKTHL